MAGFDERDGDKMHNSVAVFSPAGQIVLHYSKTHCLGEPFNTPGNDFPVGDATNFTPLDITAGTTTTAGSLTVSTTIGDHPSIASSAFDPDFTVIGSPNLKFEIVIVFVAVSVAPVVSGDPDLSLELELHPAARAVVSATAHSAIRSVGLEGVRIGTSVLRAHVDVMLYVWPARVGTKAMGM